jgi:hypothetical protein
VVILAIILSVAFAALWVRGRYAYDTAIIPVAERMCINLHNYRNTCAINLLRSPKKEYCIIYHNAREPVDEDLFQFSHPLCVIYVRIPQFIYIVFFALVAGGTWYLSNRAPARFHCKDCGYDLRGSVGDEGGIKCPECGTINCGVGLPIQKL